MEKIGRLEEKVDMFTLEQLTASANPTLIKLPTPSRMDSVPVHQDMDSSPARTLFADEEMLFGSPSSSTHAPATTATVASQQRERFNMHDSARSGDIAFAGQSGLRPILPAVARPVVSAPTAIHAPTAAPAQSRLMSPEDRILSIQRHHPDRGYPLPCLVPAPQNKPRHANVRCFQLASKPQSFFAHHIPCV